MDGVVMDFSSGWGAEEAVAAPFSGSETCSQKFEALKLNARAVSLNAIQVVPNSPWFHLRFFTFTVLRKHTHSIEIILRVLTFDAFRGY